MNLSLVEGAAVEGAAVAEDSVVMVFSKQEKSVISEEEIVMLHDLSVPQVVNSVFSQLLGQTQSLSFG